MRSGAGYRRLQIRLLQQPALVLGPRLARKPHRIVGRTRVQENLWTLRWRSRLCNPNCFRHSCVDPPPVRIIRHIGACVLAWRRRDIVARKQRRRSRPQPRQFVVVERLELLRARQRFTRSRIASLRSTVRVAEYPKLPARPQLVQRCQRGLDEDLHRPIPPPPSFDFGRGHRYARVVSQHKLDALVHADIGLGRPALQLHVTPSKAPRLPVKHAQAVEISGQANCPHTPRTRSGC